MDLELFFKNLNTKNTLAYIHTLKPLKFNKSIYFHLTNNNNKSTVLNSMRS